MNIFLVLAFFLAATACLPEASMANRMAPVKALFPETDMAKMDEDEVPYPSPPSPSPGQPSVPVTRQFIRNAEMRIRVTDVKCRPMSP